MLATVNYEGNLYGYTKDLSGKGFWHGVKGFGPNYVGNYCAVPLAMSHALSSAAIGSGIDKDIFSPGKKKKARKKAVRKSSKRSSFKVFV